MTHTQYTRRRNAAANRYALAVRAGNAASTSGDWRKMMQACRELDAAYLALDRLIREYVRGGA